MTSSDQELLQDALAQVVACLSLVSSKRATGLLRCGLLAEALSAVETIEALADPSRDGFLPTSFPPAVAPAREADRLMLVRSLMLRHGKPQHLQAAA
jgi:hypothetical protein